MFVHNFDPVLVELGPVKIHYYGVIFALLFLASYLLGRWYFKKQRWSEVDLDRAFLYMVIGTIVGTRLGHVLFYNLPYFWEHPLEILFIWQGGLSSHGGFIGLTIATFLYVRRTKLPLFQVGDLVALSASLAVLFIRVANFINGEIVGRITNVPWAVIFPCNDYIRGTCGSEPRHPVQLYEAVVGLVLFGLLFMIMKKMKYQPGLIAGLFLVSYFLVRFFLEFFKEYDGTILLPPLTNGQVLSGPVVIFGLLILYLSQFKKRQKN